MTKNFSGMAASIFGLAVVLFVVAVIAAIRMLILFPAVAVDAPGAGWRNAVDDTKGHTWRVFFIVLLTSMPFTVLSTPLTFLRAPPGPGLAGGVVWAVAETTLSVLGIAALAAVASRLYRAFSVRLGRPPGP